MQRRRLLAAASALPLFAIVRRGRAAEFSYKYASNLPLSHPLNLRAQEAMTRIRTASDGRLDIAVFPNNQLGSDTDMLSQLRSGGLEFFTLSGPILATLVPAASISGIGFAFKDYAQVWAAMDGAVGAHVRGEVARRGLLAFERIWDNGYRQMTSGAKPIHTPQDLRGFKMRVPVSPLWISLFRAFGAAPTSINFSEVYSALQTHIVDGQENPLAIIETARLYEVQTSLSLTNHMWDGYWFLANPRRFAALPKSLQELVMSECNAAALRERADVAALNATLAGKLKTQGMSVIETDPLAFRATLRAAGFYGEWRTRLGAPVWSALESVVGPLA